MLFDPETAETVVLHRIRQGDVDAYRILVDRHRNHVMRIALSHVPARDAEEVAHEAFVRAYQSLANFSGQSNFENWLARIAVRTCYDYWRKHHRRKETVASQLRDSELDWLEQLQSAESANQINELVRKREAREVLASALAELSPEDRMVLTLTYFEGQSTSQAAAALGWSRVNVKVRALRARRQLRRIIEAINECKPTNTGDQGNA